MAYQQTVLFEIGIGISIGVRDARTFRAIEKTIST